MKKLSKKARIITAAAGSALVLICVIGVTLALLKTKSDQAVNDFQGATVNIGVLEGNDVYENGDNINGEFKRIDTSKDKTVAKVVRIQNIDSKDFPTSDTFVRVRLVPIFRYDDGTSYEGQVCPQSVEPDKLKYTYGEGWADKWIVTGTSVTSPTEFDAYYYYQSAIAPGTATDPLITAVTYTGDVPKDAHLEIQVLAEGISSKQRDSVISAWTGVRVDEEGLLINE